MLTHFLLGWAYKSIFSVEWYHKCMNLARVGQIFQCFFYVSTNCRCDTVVTCVFRRTSSPGHWLGARTIAGAVHDLMKGALTSGHNDNNISYIRMIPHRPCPRVLDWFWYVLHTSCTVHTLQCTNPWSEVVQFLSKWGSLCFQWRTWLDIMGTVADIGQYMLRGWQDSVHVMSRICGLAVLVVLVERVTFSDLCVLMRPRLFRP